jgi:hypothetical protein
MHNSNLALLTWLGFRVLYDLDQDQKSTGKNNIGIQIRTKTFQTHNTAY